MKRMAIGFGIHGDRSDSYLAESADDPTGDGSAIGDQDFAEHLWLRRPDQDFNGSWIVGIARIVQLRTIADQGEHIGFGSQLDVLAGFGNSILKRQLAFRSNGNVHKEIDIAGDVAL